MAVHQILMGYWASRTLIEAVRLGIFERLARGPATAGALARDLGLSLDGTERLLLALQSLGLVQAAGGAFSNGPEAEAMLVSGRPGYIGSIAHHHSDQLWPVWTHLQSAVRHGRNVMKEAFGSGGDPFATLLATPASATRWLEGMHGGAVGLAELLMLAHDFRPHRCVVDAGGGAATIAMRLAQAHPHLQVTILERQEVCDLLPNWLAQRGMAGRVHLHPGDFFRAETFPRPADAVVLCRVLHDWDDERALAILKACHGALSPGGLVLVTEALLEPGAAPPPFPALSHLMMLALTNGGRERSGAAYETLLRQAGFRQTGVARVQGMGVIKGLK